MVHSNAGLAWHFFILIRALCGLSSLLLTISNTSLFWQNQKNVTHITFHRRFER